MALIKCKRCGHIVSTKAEACPKCGYPVRLSMEHQEDTTNIVVTPPILEEEKQKEQKYVYDDLQPQHRSKRNGMIIAIVVFVVIGCVALFALLKSNDNSNGQQSDIANVPDTGVVRKSGITPDSSKNEPKEMQYDKSFYTITKNGVANISLGSSMKDYNVSYKGERKLYYNHSFVEIQECTTEGFDYNVLYLNLYKDNKKIFSLYGGTSERKPNILSATVRSIFVYSPQFKLPNGIHTGMAAKELINDYGATLQLHEGEGGEHVEFITFEIPNMSDYIFVADKDELLKLKGKDFLDGYNSQTGYFNENFRNDIEREAKKYCKLGIIVIGNEFDTF